MAEISSFVAQLHSSLPDLGVSPIYSNKFSQIFLDQHHVDSYSASDDEIPTVDYSLLLSDDSDQKLIALEYLRRACQEYGFFYVTLLNSFILLYIYFMFRLTFNCGLCVSSPPNPNN